MKKLIIWGAIVGAVACGTEPGSPVSPSSSTGSTFAAVDVMPVVDGEDAPSAVEEEGDAIMNRAPTVDAWCKEFPDRLDLYARYSDPDGDVLTWGLIAKHVPEGEFVLIGDDGEVRLWSWYPAEGWTGETWLRAEGTDPDGASDFKIVDCTIPTPPTCEELGTCGPVVITSCEDFGTCEPPPTCEELGTCPEPPCTHDCEPPVCEDLVYTGLNPITLPNSGEATELAFVREFCPDCDWAGKMDDMSGRDWTADADYSVLLVKAGRPTHVYVNVEQGDQIWVPKDISHISKFRCMEPTS